jgi:hypothetical protein
MNILSKYAKKQGVAVPEKPKSETYYTAVLSADGTRVIISVDLADITKLKTTKDGTGNEDYFSFGARGTLDLPDGSMSIRTMGNVFIKHQD